MAAAPAGPPARTEHLDVDTARWLVGEPGRALVDHATMLLDSGRDALAVATDVRGRVEDGQRARAAVDAAEARRLARATWRDADRLLLTRAGLEQSSDPRVAAHRARRHGQATDATGDLGCGLGGDALALARSGQEVVAVDLDPGRLLLCRHNTVGADVHVVRGDALAPPLRPTATIHADPGRRPGGRRARWLRDHQPPVGSLAAAVAGYIGAGIVLSPAVALDDPDLPDAELEFVQVGPRLVEATAWMNGLRVPGAAATATVLDDRGEVLATRTRTGSVPDVPTGPVGTYLLEPAPALVRARLHHHLALEFGACRVTGDRAVLTADIAPVDSAWLTGWEVEAVVPGRPRAVADALRSLDPLPLSISLHGDERPVESWWKALKGQPRGPIGRRIHVVHGDGRTIAVLCRPCVR